MGEFGFGVRVGTLSCPTLKIEMQSYKDDVPVEFESSVSFGSYILTFGDGTQLNIHNNNGKYEYILTVSRTAMAHIRKQGE